MNKMWKSKKTIKVAVIQLFASQNKEANVSRAERLTQQAIQKGAELIVLPECFYFRGELKAKKLYETIAETVDGGVSKLFCEVARKSKVAIVMGSIYEKIKGKNKFFNTSIFIDSTGKRIGVYRKKNLFSAKLRRSDIREADIFIPGKRTKIVQYGRFLFGAAICYDLRFSEMFRFYQKKGCDVVVVPSNFTYETGKDHWEMLLRARAIENQCYILAPNQYGTDSQGMRAYGNSMIVDPWGKILARASTTKEGIIFATLDKRVILNVRKRLGNMDNGAWIMEKQKNKQKKKEK